MNFTRPKDNAAIDKMENCYACYSMVHNNGGKPANIMPATGEMSKLYRVYLLAGIVMASTSNAYAGVTAANSNLCSFNATLDETEMQSDPTNRLCAVHNWSMDSTFGFMPYYFDLQSDIAKHHWEDPTLEGAGDQPPVTTDDSAGGLPY